MAVATADIHIKIDPSVKSEAEKNFAECGTTMSRFINDVLRSFNRDFKERREILEKYSVPESLRIETREQLVRILRERAESGKDYKTTNEAREMVLGGKLGAASEKI